MQASDSHISVLSPYHFVIIPEEDKPRFGDQAWTMGSWDGQSFSLGHQA